jgi:hypothetical protein
MFGIRGFSKSRSVPCDQQPIVQHWRNNLNDISVPLLVKVVSLWRVVILRVNYQLSQLFNNAVNS